MKTVFEKIGSIRMPRKSSSGDGGPAVTRRSSSGSAGAYRPSARCAALAAFKDADEARKATEARLSALEPFIIDTTIPDCLDIGQVSAEEKLSVFETLRNCGLRHLVVAAFVRDRAHDGEFLSSLRARGLVDAHTLATCELFDANGSDLPGQDLPYGLAKMLQYGIQNAVLECDLAASYINWSKYSVDDFCALVESRCRWVASNLYAGRPQPPAAWVRLRDFGAAMQSAPGRVLALVESLAALPPGVRPEGVILQQGPDPPLPADAGAPVAAVRAVMEAGGWGQGRLLVQVQPCHGLGAAGALAALAAGAAGVAAALGGEGEAPAPLLLLGAALAARGNPHVGRGYDMARLRAAAAAVAAAMARGAEAAAAAAAAAPPPRAAAGAVAAHPSASPSRAAPAAAQSTPLIIGHA